MPQEDPKTQQVIQISPNATGRTNAAPLADDPLVSAIHVVVRNEDGSDPQPTTIAYDDIPPDILKLPFLEFVKALPQVRLTVLDARMPPEQRKALEAENLKAETARLAKQKADLEKETTALLDANAKAKAEKDALAKVDADFAAFKEANAKKSAVAQPVAKP